MAVAGLDRALGGMRIGGGERGANVFQPDAVLIEGIRIELDPHRRQRTAVDDDLADPADLGQFLRQHRRGGVIKLALAKRIGGQREDQDRGIGRIDFLVGRVRAQAGRQVRVRRIDGGLDVPRGAIDIAVEAKLQVDAHRADAAAGRHLGHVGDLPEVAFERGRHCRRHDLRARARQLGAHRYRRIIDLRQRRHRQLEKRHRTRGKDAEGQQNGGDRAPDERG